MMMIFTIMMMTMMMKKRKRKTENNATKLDDRRGRIRRNEEKGTKQREMASMDIII